MEEVSKFESKVLAAFAAAVVVVVILAATTWKVSRDAIEAALLVSHSHEVLNNLAHARGDTLLIELNTQNYRLSGEPARVAERDVAIAARDISLRRIRELTSDNARQQQRWTQLRQAVDERLAISRRAVLLRETEGVEAANAYIASAPLRETRERLFQMVREMEQEELRLLAQRSAEQLRVRDIAVAAGALAALGLVALLSVTYILIRRQLRETEASRRALEAARKDADAANRAKSTFLASMSHEIRTPMNAILGFSRLMRNAPDVTPEQVRNLDIIFRSSEHLLNLINNVLDISKIESGRVALEETEFDLHHLLHEVQSLTHVRAAEKQLGFNVMFGPDLPRHILADAGKLRQVLINLVANATKFTQDGGVVLRATVVKSEAPQPARIRFEVEDTGPGIREQDRARLFSPFVQLANQPLAEPGTGLGLVISKQYVDLMGGSIGVDSVPGKGSVFHFEIPVNIGSAPSGERSANPLNARVAALAPDQEHYRLLIAEDQPENRLLLREMLEPLGFEVHEAANGLEAVALAARWHPHLIWMDIRMPEMDGLQATRQIKSSTADTKVVAVTAHALEEERAEILAAGCDCFIRKPYGDADIFEALKKHLDVRFLYAEPHADADAARVLELDAAQLALLPAALVEELRLAVLLLEGGRCLEVVERIAGIDDKTGARLRDMVKNLQFKELLGFLDSLAARTHA